MTGGRQPFVLAGAFFVIVLALYSPVLGGKPFVDDWVYVMQEPARHIFGAFTELHPYGFYRPVPLAINSTLQIAGDGSPVPIHLFSFLIHAVLAGVVVWFAGRLGVSRRGALLAGVFMTITQAAAAAVGGYDTLSISLATLFGTSAVALMVGRARIVPAVFLYAAALLSKESALGYLPLLLVCATRAYPPGPRVADPASHHRRVVPVAVAFLAMTVVYLAWRSHLGGFAPTPGAGVYNMNIGPGMIRNLVMLWFVALVPVSSVGVFTSVVQHDAAGIMPGAVAAGIMLILMLTGFLTRGRRGHALVLVIAASVAVAPVLPLTRVSELYASSMLPFVAILFGESVVRLARRNRIAGVMVSAAVAVVFLVNSSAVGEKARAMAQAGRQAERLLRDILGEVSSLPPNATLVLIDPQPELPNYSVFRVRSFLLVPDQTIFERSGRDDVTIVRIPAGQDLTHHPDPALRALTLDKEARLVPEGWDP